MKKLSSQEIRNTWLNFFKERGHMVEPGASLIPQNDPTLLWINSGVAALKKYFDGSVVPPCRRITNVQKSIRTNDIENVGKTARHHTFFEMLGNFSIGDYFRKEVIEWAFDILTNEKYFGLDVNKIYVTYNPSDIETKKLWIKAGLDVEHLIPLEGNYWQIGEGPCGPNTEVFFDRGEKYDKENVGIKLLKEDLENDRYIELWGIVFSQYNAVNGVERKDYKELPSKNIDTGAGLERITCVLQETETNFETDLFMPMIKQVEKITNVKYESNKMAFRVIADHSRSCVFALADGEYFSNEGRGYVLRRLLRRAMRYGMQLGINEPFLYKLVPTIITVMKGYYPYLISKDGYLQKLIKSEEEKFIKTLHTGGKLLDSILDKNERITGEEVFKLYDTYGFPVELTKEICEERGISVNMEDFKKLMEIQKERARSSRNGLESMNKQSKDLMDFTTPSAFNYDKLSLKGKVISLFKDGKSVNSIDDEGYAIFDKTPFYAEMGGQISDDGQIFNSTTRARVDDVTVAPQKQNLHHITLQTGEIKVGDLLTLEVNKERRIQIECNHSATHLLHAALEKILGCSIEQKGSFVSDKYLRFDFNHLDKISIEQLQEIEKTVNCYINNGLVEETMVLDIEEAIKTGAKHDFGDKYGDSVRVVTFGEISKEFCGGTHVKNTKDIGIFIIKSEESIAAGTRRIEACTGSAVYEELKARERTEGILNSLVSSNSLIETIDKMKSIINENKELVKANNELNDKISATKAEELILNVKKINNINVILNYDSSNSRESITKISDFIKAKLLRTVIVLIGKKSGETYPIVISLTKDLTNELKAGIILARVVNILGGSGGGRPDYACGAVKNVDHIDQIENLIKELI